MQYKTVSECRVCKSNRLVSYLELGSLPLANGLLSSKEQDYTNYPLQVLLCQDCYLSQLSIVVDPKILYRNYPYRSSVSSTFRKHCYYMGKKLKELHDDYWGHSAFDEADRPSPTVIDIGANDGCLLHQFKRHGIKPLFAVEPDTSLREYFDKDIMVLDNFWSDKSIASLQRLLGLPQAEFITATNVFAHCDDIHGFVKGVYNMLLPQGTFVLEVPYAYNMIVDSEFDTVYHEHLSYFLLHTLVKLFSYHNMTVWKVEQYPIHGGTIRLYVGKGEREVDESVERLLNLEKAGGMLETKTYEDFSKRLEGLKLELVELIAELKSQGKKVVGFGASAKGCTLLNYFKIDSLDYIIDDTPSKQGKWVPGVTTLVQAYDWHTLQEVDYILLLAWNFRDEIIGKMNASGYKGKWIVPIPQVEVL